VYPSDHSTHVVPYDNNSWQYSKSRFQSDTGTRHDSGLPAVIIPQHFPWGSTPTTMWPAPLLMSNLINTGALQEASFKIAIQFLSTVTKGNWTSFCKIRNRCPATIAYWGIHIGKNEQSTKMPFSQLYSRTRANATPCQPSSIAASFPPLHSQTWIVEHCYNTSRISLWTELLQLSPYQQVCYQDSGHVS